jgi:hypothetical protein
MWKWPVMAWQKHASLFCCSSYICNLYLADSLYCPKSALVTVGLNSLQHFVKIGNKWRTERGVWGVQPPPPKFRSFDKAEPNSQFRGKYIRNNLTRIRLTLIFLVVSWKAHPARYNPHSGFFFSPRHDASIVTDVWISAIRIPLTYSTRYRWSPRSHEQDDPVSWFPFVVHFVLILL